MAEQESGSSSQKRSSGGYFADQSPNATPSASDDSEFAEQKVTARTLHGVFLRVHPDQEITAGEQERTAGASSSSSSTGGRKSSKKISQAPGQEDQVWKIPRQSGSTFDGKRNSRDHAEGDKNYPDSPPSGERKIENSPDSPPSGKKSRVSGVFEFTAVEEGWNAFAAVEGDAWHAADDGEGGARAASAYDDDFWDLFGGKDQGFSYGTEKTPFQFQTETVSPGGTVETVVEEPNLNISLAEGKLVDDNYKVDDDDNDKEQKETKRTTPPPINLADVMDGGGMIHNFKKPGTTSRGEIWEERPSRASPGSSSSQQMDSIARGLPKRRSSQQPSQKSKPLARTSAASGSVGGFGEKSERGVKRSSQQENTPLIGRQGSTDRNNSYGAVSPTSGDLAVEHDIVEDEDDEAEDAGHHSDDINETVGSSSGAPKFSLVPDKSLGPTSETQAPSGAAAADPGSGEQYYGTGADEPNTMASLQEEEEQGEMVQKPEGTTMKGKQADTWRFCGCFCCILFVCLLVWGVSKACERGAGADFFDDDGGLRFDESDALRSDADWMNPTTNKISKDDAPTSKDRTSPKNDAPTSKDGTISFFNSTVESGKKIISDEVVSVETGKKARDILEEGASDASNEEEHKQRGPEDVEKMVNFAENPKEGIVGLRQDGKKAPRKASGDSPSLSFMEIQIGSVSARSRSSRNKNYKRDSGGKKSVSSRILV